MRSRAASASGSATVVLRQRFLQRPSRPAIRISLVTRRLPQATWRWPSSLWTRGGSIGSLGLVVDDLDLLGQLGVSDLTGRGDAIAPLVVGGTGDLEQATRLGDVVTCNLLRLDEGIQPHRVSLAKKIVARLRISTSSRRERFSRRSLVSSARASVVRPGRSPASVSAWCTQARTAVSPRSKSLATWPMLRSPRRHSSTISD